MTFRLEFMPEATREFEEAVAYYAKAKKGLGRRFAKGIREVLARLRRMPKVHGFAKADVRRAVVPSFLYVILYRVTDKTVIIISVFHTKRDPSDWQEHI